MSNERRTRTYRPHPPPAITTRLLICLDAGAVHVHVLGRPAYHDLPALAALAEHVEAAVREIVAVRRREAA